MTMIATRTLRAIEDIITNDQGASFRQWSGRVLPHVGDAYRGSEKPFRKHLGASIIGGECGRAVYYSFRWFTLKLFPARLMRLFNRGHLEEGRFIAMLLMIGCQVYQQDVEGKQYTISDAYGHFGGSGDGVVIGLPDVPEGAPALMECKTHGDKSFQDLLAKGMRTAKHEHYVQMQVYMRKMGLFYGLYFAVNKNTDEIYMEIVEVDVQTAEQYLDRGTKIVFLRTPPKRISETSSFWKCKFCDHRPVCHLGAIPYKSCRTCIHSVPLTDNSKDWGCELHSRRLNEDAQYAACPDWTPIK